MKPESNHHRAFLTFYIQSLGERTRDEEKGTKFGFDWTIYNLNIVGDWVPYRLPFIRSGHGETAKTKTEAEFGIDLAFLSGDGTRLRIFVLKDEALKNATWHKNFFDADLRSAASPPLDDPLLANVRSVHIILAYNKDEDHNGVELYNRLTIGLGDRLNNGVTRTFERWNLSRIVEEVREKLLSPQLLPQKFYSQFAYVCSQVAEFAYGSDEWQQQLTPNWRRFLSTLLGDHADERSVRLLPVALVILKQHLKSSSAETAWIDLIEWAVLAAWNVRLKSDKRRVKEAVEQIWVEMYILELDNFYHRHAKSLSIRHSLDQPLSGCPADAGRSAIVANWHIARLGILGGAFANAEVDDRPESAEFMANKIDQVAIYLIELLNANPSAMRPLIDLHHVELVLASMLLRSANRNDDHLNWLHGLVNALWTRRTGIVEIPFPEGRNSLQLVFEALGTGEVPADYLELTSLYVMCLLEIACYSVPHERDILLHMAWRKLVIGQRDDEQQIAPLDLMCWLPPEDWADRILISSLAYEGASVSVHLNPPRDDDPSGDVLYNSISAFVAETRAKQPFIVPDDLPLPVIFLACLKHRTPLPPELWRDAIFRAQPNT